MNPASILEAITAAIAIAKSLVQVGQDVGPIITMISDILKKGHKVTQAELDDLITQSEAWSAELEQPVPDEEL